MRLQRLDIRDFRCIRSACIEPSAQFNVIYGRNGSGKTSLVEAIYMLAVAKSFRTGKPQDVIQAGCTASCIAARLVEADGNILQIGLERTLQEIRMRCDGRSLKGASELARRMPVVLVSPDTPTEFFTLPKVRRRLLDIALFHVEPAYLHVYRDFLKCIKSRNHLLRTAANDAEIQAWDEELIRTARFIHNERVLAAEALGVLAAYLTKVLLGFDLEIKYLLGWPKERDFADALRSGLRGDRQAGYTRVGPHRADLELRVENVAASNRFSRGQLKLLAAAGYLAQALYIKHQTGKRPLVLVDDLVSDLDPGARRALIGVLEDLDSQVFLTTVAPENIPLSGRTSVTMFHVEQGQIREAA